MRSLVQRIGVSAYGYGGTNAHAILESVQSHVPNYPRRKFAQQVEGVSNGVAQTDIDTDDDQPHLLVFSAHDNPTLKITSRTSQLHVAMWISLTLHIL